MIDGHGDDAYKYGHRITMNFSSNVYNHVDHTGLREHLCRQMEHIRSYPEPEPYTLEAELAGRLHLSGDEVCVTNGATEAIYLIAQTFRGAVSAILMPTFSEYADACRLHGHRVQPVYVPEAIPGTAGLAWICNPNNPTGTVWDKGALKALIRRYPACRFVIDQSYEYFTRKELFSAQEAAAYPNVVLLHSMTKRFAVPGLRLGYMTANKNLLHEIRLQRMPWAVNRLAIDAGQYLLEHPEEYGMDIDALLQEKERLCAAIGSVGGMDVWHSDTHYMLVRLRTGRAAALKDYLAEKHGILIRDASNFEGLDAQFFRIATQAPEENDKLIDGIKEWMALF